jgi:hypothetical protein
MRLVALFLVIFLAVGCGSDQQSGQISMEVVTVPEGNPIGEAALPGRTDVKWVQATASSQGWPGSPEPRNKVMQTIGAEAKRLVAVDYASLSLPDFVSVTQSLKLDEGMFAEGSATPNVYGQDSSGGSWALYEWRGPEIPQQPDRPLVHRWVYVYALYNMNDGQVVRLLPTIRGEAQE